VLLGFSEAAMHNEFVDEPALCPRLSRVRVCDPFCIAGDAFKPSFCYRLVCVETGAGESILFCFDRVTVLAPSVSVMLEEIHRLVVNDVSVAPDTVWYEFGAMNWLKIGPTFLPVRFDGNHLKDCGPWLPLQWVAEQHLIDPKCVEFLAGAVFELVTAANVSELADSRPGDEREQIRRLAGLSSETEVAGTTWDATLPKPRVFEPGAFDIEAYIQWLKKLGQ
jgi:hypothetical protein